MDWIDLEIKDKNTLGRIKKQNLFISTPKKIVPLATKRNRIKRLIKEVVRKHELTKDTTKEFFFKIRRVPKELDFSSVERQIKAKF